MHMYLVILVLGVAIISISGIVSIVVSCRARPPPLTEFEQQVDE